MANPEHVKILKQGVKVWNKWREDNPEIRIDLHSINLSEEDLTQVNFAKADLRESILTDSNLNFSNLYMANLSKTTLSGASFQKANLSDANLTNAIIYGAFFIKANLNSANLSYANFFLTNLEEANLYNVDLGEANLSNTFMKRANLCEASLRGTNLTSSDLSNTNWENADILETVFADTNLSEAKDLDKLKVIGPSTIDHRTLIRSKNLPRKFLEDCGLPEQFIDNLPSLLNSLEPIQFHSVFISYSSQDEEFAKRLHTDLRAKGIRCWFAPEDMKIGDEIRPRIDEMIHVHDKLLLVLSKDSVNSNWVKKEVETAFEKEDASEKTVLFPIRLDDTVMDIKIGWPADIKRTRHIGDFKEWKDHDAYQKSFDRLLKDLKQKC